MINNNLGKKCLLISLLFAAFSGKAQLVINEVSQGAQNPTVEYVELIVTGTNTCSTSTQDLRNWIIDDNNGTFSPGAGSGIAAGCIRFKNIAFWQNIKIGTLILIYDDGVTSVNPLIPANDLNANDGNCRLIIPYSNTSLIEKHATQPGISNSTYPATSAAFTSANAWTSVIGMRNGGDAFQVRNPANYSIPAHAVSWGDNANNPIIYFAGDAQKHVFNMKNLVNNNPANQANWTSDSTLTGETPGLANNAQNSTWINSLSNNCQAFVGANLSITASSAAPYCEGETVVLSSSLLSGNLWSTGDTTSTITVNSNTTISLTNAAACLPANLTLTFDTTQADFSVDTTEGFAPLTVHFTNQSMANATTFSWNFADGTALIDSTNPNHTFANAGVYQVMLTASTVNGCSDSISLKITVNPPIDLENKLEIPNIFTPNSDGINDKFLILSNNVENFKGSIFDRWGNKLHDWTNINEGWDGRTRSGMKVTSGVFFYLIDVTFKDGTSIHPKGTITLIK